jgi:hypothetical protein
MIPVDATSRIISESINDDRCVFVATQHGTAHPSEMPLLVHPVDFSKNIAKTLSRMGSNRCEQFPFRSLFSARYPVAAMACRALSQPLFPALYGRIPNFVMMRFT